MTLFEASPELFLNAYLKGIFPMAESAEDADFNFYAPKMRALLPILDLHIPKKLLKTIKQQPYEVKINTAFADVIDACASTHNNNANTNNKDRQTTWINTPIRNTFIELHEMGFTHSVEAWHDDELVGGLYGLAIGQVFCGESMFSRKNDASKIALVHLCARLYGGGFKILDTQFVNDHLKQFGVYEMPQTEYEILIQDKMLRQADFLQPKKNAAQLLENYLTHRRAS